MVLTHEASFSTGMKIFLTHAVTPDLQEIGSLTNWGVCPKPPHTRHATTRASQTTLFIDIQYALDHSFPVTCLAGSQSHCQPLEQNQTK